MTSGSEADLTRLAGTAYGILLATDTTHIAQLGYQSLLESRPQAQEAPRTDRYKDR
jgi:hypothetical protein